jgi:glyceraldehyde-3-phosphate dehydrogenase/erythrose-4-phosphate dehydrogenase
MAEVPEKKGNLYTGKSVIVPIMDGSKPDLQYAVVTSKTRQEVLEMPVNASSAGEQMLAEATGGNTAKITKADVLGLLEISEDEFAAIIAKKYKK